MIHPDTELRFVSPAIGHGVFATAPIPKGTIVYVKDMLEIVLDESAYAALNPSCQAVADKYSYIDELGQRILSWDHAKYVNHRCDCNTMSTSFGFEIALRDIAPGEEITDEYGLFNIDEVVPLACGCSCCRGALRPSDIDAYHAAWDAQVRDALENTLAVAQPLLPIMDEATRNHLLAYCHGEAAYTSVRCLKYDRTAHEASVHRLAV